MELIKTKDPENDKTENIETFSDVVIEKMNNPNHPVVDDPNQDKFLLQPCSGYIGGSLQNLRKGVKDQINKKSSFMTLILKMICLILVLVYIGLLINNFISTGKSLNWCYGHGKAFIYIGFAAWCLLYYKGFKKFVTPPLNKLTNSPSYQHNIMYMKYSIYLLFIAGFIVFIIFDTTSNRRRLVSLLGLMFFLSISFVFSKYPEYIRWDTVISGTALQIAFGLLTIRWETGRYILQCFGDNIVTFLDFGLEGAIFAYGEKLIIGKEAVFAFQALSVLYFLAMITRVLFYLGWLQKFCFKIGGFIEMFLSTTVIESVNAATIIFLGMSEAPLLYSEYLADLTSSEIHAVMASGFSTIAGTLLTAYATLGVDPRYVVTASIMAAPASLCYAKLLYPETDLSKTSSNRIQLLKSTDTSFFQAAINGASSASAMIQGIIASVISCIAFVAFLSALCSWLGNLIGFEGITLEYLVGLLFVPIAWLMGVVPEECLSVGSLIGIKTIANELVAYKQLGQLKRQGKLSVRSEAIATFALCAFSNPGSLGSSIATLSSLERRQSERINKVALRAFITGCITTFASSCIAGLLTDEEDRYVHLNTTLSLMNLNNGTLIYQ